MSLLTNFVTENDDCLRTLADMVRNLETCLDEFDTTAAMQHARAICVHSRSVRLALMEVTLYHDDPAYLEDVLPLMQRVVDTLSTSYPIAGENADFIERHIGLAERIEQDIAEALATQRARAAPDANVFISYVSENQQQAIKLKKALVKHGIGVWLDRDELQPGVRWKQAITQAILGGEFFIALFSEAYVARRTTFMNEELTLAVEELRKRPRDHGWFVPVLLDDCSLPFFDLGAGETLDDIQYVTLANNWQGGVRKIVNVLNKV